MNQVLKHQSDIIRIAAKIEELDKQVTELKKMVNLIAKDDIINSLFLDVSKAFKTHPHQLIKRSKKQKLVLARLAFFNLARWLYGYSTTDIGRFCGMDHSTIIYHTKRDFFELQISQYPEFEEAFAELLEKHPYKAICQDS